MTEFSPGWKIWPETSSLTLNDEGKLLPPFDSTQEGGPDGDRCIDSEPAIRDEAGYMRPQSGRNRGPLNRQHGHRNVGTVSVIEIYNAGRRLPVRSGC